MVPTGPPRVPPAPGAYHFQGLETERLAELLLWTSTGLQLGLALWIFICWHSGATPSWRSVFRPASLPEASEQPHREDQPFSEVWSSESSVCSFLPPFCPRAA